MKMREEWKELPREAKKKQFEKVRTEDNILMRQMII